MSVIHLTKGLSTIVDFDLYEELSQFKWYASGLFREARPARRVGNRIVLMYHQILGEDPWSYGMTLHVDHINRNTLDNRRENLRIVTPSQNQLNSARLDKPVGVGRDNTHDTWKAYIERNGVRKNIGTFKTYEEALAARNAWEE